MFFKSRRETTIFDQFCFRGGLKPKNLPCSMDCSMRNPAHSCPFPLSCVRHGGGRNRRTCQKNHSSSTRSWHISNVSTPDEELRRRFKNEIGSMRKKAEQALVEALVKYHHRRAERLTNKLRKLEQYKPCRNTVRNNMGILSRRLTRKRNHRLERKLSTKMTM